MGTPRPPDPALLVVGVLAPGEELVDRASRALAGRFGPVAVTGPTVRFDFTDYYDAEMGTGLLRCWLGFDRPFDPGRLAEAKLATGGIERSFARPGGDRAVNLDPGIVTLHSLVLASTKSYAHRVYLGDGVYAEPTLLYRSGRWEPLPWTYPDYRTDACHLVLSRLRELLVARSRPGGLTPPPGTD